MYWCDVSQCVDPKAKDAQCHKQPSGKKCEHAIWGCPKCHGKNIIQTGYDSWWLKCEDCGYMEVDD